MFNINKEIKLKQNTKIHKDERSNILMLKRFPQFKWEKLIRPRLVSASVFIIYIICKTSYFNQASRA